jgi:hypothetical protein
MDIALLILCPGMHSMDYVLGLDVRLQQAAGWSVLAVGVIGALGNLALRRPVAAQLTMQRKGRDA